MVKRKNIFIIYLIGSLIILLFPPYCIRNYNGYDLSLGCHFILNPPFFERQYFGEVDLQAWVVEFLFLLFSVFLTFAFFRKNSAECGDTHKGEREEIKIKSKNVNLTYESVLSELREHIVCDSFSREALQEAYDTEYDTIIEKRENLPLRERYNYDQDDASPKPHLAELAVISALLDDIGLYDKLVEYLYTIELDSFDMRPSAGFWVEKARDIKPRRLFNDVLFECAINYLKLSRNHEAGSNERRLEIIEDRLNVFNVLVACHVT